MYGKERSKMFQTKAKMPSGYVLLVPRYASKHGADPSGLEELIPRAVDEEVRQKPRFHLWR